MTLNFAKFFPLISQVGNYLKMGIDYYADLRSAGKEASADIVAIYLQMKMADWDPKVGAASLLDPDTKAAGARFLAGVAVNFAQV